MCLMGALLNAVLRSSSKKKKLNELIVHPPKAIQSETTEAQMVAMAVLHKVDVFDRA